jgi:hypothetical protein
VLVQYSLSSEDACNLTTVLASLVTLDGPADFVQAL